MLQGVSYAKNIIVINWLGEKENVDEIIERAEYHATRFLEEESHKIELKHHLHGHVKDLELSDRQKIGYTFYLL